MQARRYRHAGLIFIALAALSIAGCAYPTSEKRQNVAETEQWRGRLALRVSAEGLVASGEAGAEPQPQSMSASFELTGNAQTGALLLFSPLGITVAEMNWSAQTVFMRANGETRSFNSLSEMLKQATGTDIPVTSLFAWLAGDNATASGWQVDLTQHALGRIVARRSVPIPAVELRLIIEK
jgi:outer membrane lipoprotein LolB